ncbi:MAG: 30S ribosome-binding factor RbfA [Candidatus Margulisbacteria bacterium]|nr:30S ribosome-binding factor RbfA [Candidatus Margulisiibacteriota bacterium]
MSRIDRINALIKEEIAHILQRKMRDQHIGFISITNVDVSKDMSHAKIYFSQIGTDKEKKKTLNTLKTASRFIKGEIGKVIRLKHIPDLQFIFDESLERGFDIVDKINKLSK